MKHKVDNKVAVSVFFAAFLFAMMEVVLKIGENGLDSYQLTFLRFTVGGLFLLPFAIVELKKKHVKLSISDFGYMLYLGALCVAVSMVFFQLAVASLNASTAAVLFCINPVFTIIFAHFLTDEKLNKKKIYILILGITGLIFMISPWNLQEGNSISGAIMMITAALLFALYSVRGKKHVGRIGIIPQTSISFLLGSGVLLVTMIIIGKPIAEGVAENIGLILFVGAIITGVGYFLYFYAINHAGATTGAIVFFIKPALAPVMAMIVLGDKILWNTIVGIGFILVASYINISLINKKAVKNDDK